MAVAVGHNINTYRMGCTEYLSFLPLTGEILSGIHLFCQKKSALRIYGLVDDGHQLMRISYYKCLNKLKASCYVNNELIVSQLFINETLVQQT